MTAAADHRTRDRLAEHLLHSGGATVTELAETLGVSPAGVRRHLEAMLADGDVTSRERPVRGHRGRGRPARIFQLTERARLRRGTHTYDDFAAQRVAALEAHCRAMLEDAGSDPMARAEALASALTAEGYAASASTIATGGQLCQHHCPVAHVAAEFPQLCEAETQVISRLVGTHVQRLATIAHGDGVCTTHIPDPRRLQTTTTNTETVRTAS